MGAFAVTVGGTSGGLTLLGLQSCTVLDRLGGSFLLLAEQTSVRAHAPTSWQPPKNKCKKEATAKK
jgi:hypothetical protein